MVYETILHNKKFSQDFGLRNQIERAAVSVMSNIAEGFGRKSDRELIQFLTISRGSVSELQSQLYIALDLNYIDSTKFNRLYEKSSDVAKLINGFIRYLRKTKN
jgi:four helix bundle protein